ncbi:MAG: TetR/AcrR family transcriptional regulator [Desulfuromonadales bacterium]|nr:TetR/AcrR family transcriptional regulator [Desulfuromonadales bacterium]
MAARKAQFSREEIIDAAFEMVRENGWKGLSVPALAKAINCSTMPVYSHFKNVRELEDVVYLKALDFLTEFMMVQRSGDVWLDHAINYTRFAAEERQLFHCLFDGRNPELQMVSLRKWAQLLAEQLSDYPLFEGLSEEQIHTIRYSRFMLIHGIASGINNGWHMQKNKTPDELENFLRKASKALFDGLKAQFEAEDLE